MKNSKFLVAIVSMTASLVSAQTWTQTSAPVTNWTAITCSADGVKLAAFAGGGVIYTSTNSGATWNPGTNAPLGNLRVASSADGTKLVVAVNGGGIYRSIDSGLTWTQTSAPSNAWVSIASSADGNKLTALAQVAPSPDFYTSSDGGNTWNTNASPYDRWTDLACSADGNTLVACGPFTILSSTNLGSSWTTNITYGSGSARSVASSADGKRLMAAGVGGGQNQIYVSTNSGLAWNQINAPSIGRLVSSADGSKLAATGYSGYMTNLPVYVSTNFGVTWTTNDPPGIDYWTSVQPLAFSADGTKLFAAVNGGRIWTAQTAPEPQMNITPTDDNLLLSWIIPSTNFTLEQNSDLTTPNWTDVTNTPGLDLTNLRDEVLLPLTVSNVFYRLAQ